MNLKAGLFFFSGVLLVGLEMLILERFQWSRIEIDSTRDQPASAARAVDPFRITVPLIVTVLICAGALGITTSIASAYKSAPAPIRQSFADFPRQIGAWVGQPETD